jgi:hypothetical protein
MAPPGQSLLQTPQPTQRLASSSIWPLKLSCNCGFWKGYPAVAGLAKTKVITFLNIGDILTIFLHLEFFGRSKLNMKWSLLVSELH